ncbi:uncharacterized protein AMSG_00436 [Thecamonas trahens ATCC 50062]|uniref:Right handed beta helix domain-containing protein n=1 Tax=Thecamonas trahens ATCC 50062 TaxID=461836 RepID=A0A0L0DBI7_THETB|nr:hypothetical protein AMSG_00436 [Thecamonas trahens ATCC 50062]KNC48658.1 hypothetical protein AMSG_00436 [Thecamonas trahens ATCC 50062]|eukprot:XP_013762714.1 hypothetical protein AMSG_00436 [Thecamonas trahens ATCC 50062]
MTIPPPYVLATLTFLFLLYTVAAGKQACGGSLVAPTLIDLNGAVPRHLVLSDVDADGNTDVVYGNDGKVLGWFENNVAGSGYHRWVPHVIDLISESIVLVGLAPNLAGDGETGILVLTQYRVLAYPRSTLAPYYMSETSRDIASDFSSADDMAVIDIDADGLPDVVVSSTIVIIYMNIAAEPGFFAPNDAENTFSPFLAAGDISGDGVPDLALASSSRLDWIPLNADGTFSGTPQLVASPSPSIQSDGAIIADMDGDLDGDIVVFSNYRSNIVLALNDGAGGSWTTSTVISSVSSMQHVVVADGNGDGKLDVFAAVFSGNRIYFYAGDGVGGFAASTTAVSTTRPYTVVVGHVDGDAVVDVVAGRGSDVGIAFGNGDGTFGSPPGTPVAMANPGGLSAAITSSDVDGDGIVDVVVVWANGGLAWHRNLGDGSFVLGSVVEASMMFVPMTIAAVDVEGDGDVDLVLGRVGVTNIIWYANDGAGIFTSMGTLDPLGDAVVVVTADIDGDLDDDLFALRETTSSVWWLPNLGGGSFGSAIAIDTSQAFMSEPTSAAFADFDSSGSLDCVVVFRSDNALAWYENTAGDGSTWTRHNLPYTPLYPFMVRAGDFNNDGRPDVVVSSEGQLAWLANVQPKSPSPHWTVHIIDSGSLYDLTALAIGDINGDGRHDIAFASDVSGAGGLHLLAWYPGLDSGGFGSRKQLSSEFHAKRLLILDVDGDGLGDVVAQGTSPSSDSSIALFRNDLGAMPATSKYRGLISRKEAVPNAPSEASFVAAGDVDGDLIVDVVFVGESTDVVAWQRGVGGGELDTAPRSILSDFNGASMVVLVDVDTDGDLDVIAAAATAGVPLIWAENVGATGDFAVIHTISTQSPPGVSYIEAVDIDSDTDWDVVSVWSTRKVISVFVNLDGSGTYSNEVVVATSVDAWKCVLTDVDGDGDTDIVALGTFSSLYYYINTGGAGLAWTAASWTLPSSYHTEVADTRWAVADFDADGALDVVHRVLGPTPLHFVHFVSDVSSAAPTAVALQVFDRMRYAWPVDVDADGDLDLVILTQVEKYIGVFENIIADVPGGAAPIAGTPFVYPFHLVASAAYQSTVPVLVDMDSDGDMDWLFSSGSPESLFWIPAVTAPSAFYEPSPQQVMFDDSLAACGSARGSFACLAANIGRTSRCVRDTLVLPARTFGCRLEAHFPIAHEIVLDGRAGASFDCTPLSAPTEVGGVLFQVVSGGYLELQHLAVTKTGSARTSLLGSPGLRADGAGARLVLTNVTLTRAVSDTSVNPNRVLAGYGGALMATSGASLRVVDTVVSDAVAAVTGGALYVADAESSATLINSMIVECTAKVSGGAISVSSLGTVFLHNSTLARNTAAAGFGGGLFVDVGGRAEVIGTNMVSNSALGGGGVFVRPGSSAAISSSALTGNIAAVGGALATADASVDAVTRASSMAEVPTLELGAASNASAITLVDSVVRSNTGVSYGGGAFLCDGSSASMLVAGSGSIWSDNVALRGGALGSSADVLVCAHADGTDGGSIVTSAGVGRPASTGL